MICHHRKFHTSNSLIQCIRLTIGSFLVAVAIDMLLTPNGLIDGGVIGLAMLFAMATKTSLGALVFIFNLPFLWVGYYKLGRGFTIWSLFSIACLSLFIHLLHPLAMPIHPIAAIGLAGVLIGLGLGIIIGHCGSLDGVEVVAIICSRCTSFSVGSIILALNVLVFAWGGFLLGWQQSLYSLLTYMVACKTVDWILR